MGLKIEYRKANVSFFGQVPNKTVENTSSKHYPQANQQILPLSLHMAYRVFHTRECIGLHLRKTNDCAPVAANFP